MQGDDVLPLAIVFAELLGRTYHKKIEPLPSQAKSGTERHASESVHLSSDHRTRHQTRRCRKWAFENCLGPDGDRQVQWVNASGWWM